MNESNFFRGRCFLNYIISFFMFLKQFCFNVLLEFLIQNEKLFQLKRWCHNSIGNNKGGLGINHALKQLNPNLMYFHLN